MLKKQHLSRRIVVKTTEGTSWTWRQADKPMIWQPLQTWARGRRQEDPMESDAKKREQEEEDKKREELQRWRVHKRLLEELLRKKRKHFDVLKFTIVPPRFHISSFLFSEFSLKKEKTRIWRFHVFTYFWKHFLKIFSIKSNQTHFHRCFLFLAKMKTENTQTKQPLIILPTWPPFHIAASSPLRFPHLQQHPHPSFFFYFFPPWLSSHFSPASNQDGSTNGKGKRWLKLPGT